MRSKGFGHEVLGDLDARDHAGFAKLAGTWTTAIPMPR
jgi:hypothetical protein